MKKKKTRKSKLGIVSLLTILFIFLKLTGVISWSWIWVFSPIWISAICAALMFGAVLIGGRIAKGKW